MEPSYFAKRVIALAGGPVRLRKLIDADMRAFDQAWNRDTDLIGRLLRAHLAVEHFMTACLGRRNPRLGSLEAARLTFAQKLALLDDKDVILAAIRPGIKRLNELRNGLAHRPSRPLQDGDVEPLLAVGIFRALREALAVPNAPSTEPIDIVEEFARFAAGMLQHKISDLGHLIGQALADS